MLIIDQRRLYALVFILAAVRFGEAGVFKALLRTESDFSCLDRPKWTIMYKV